MNLVDLLSDAQQQSREVLAELASLRAELEALRMALEENGQINGDERFLRLVHAAMGDTCFATCELVARGLQADRIGEQLAMSIAGQSVRSIGRRLASLTDKLTSIGLLLQRVGNDRDGALWQVCVVKPA